MLDDLKVINGVLTPSFDPYNNIYSVQIEEDVTKLVLEYKVKDDYSITIVGNENLNEGENEVYIQVINDQEINTYTLLVYKEISKSVSAFVETGETVEVVEELPDYVAPLIGGVCFFIILIMFLILFRRKKKG